MNINYDAIIVVIIMLGFVYMFVYSLKFSKLANVVIVAFSILVLVLITMPFVNNSPLSVSMLMKNSTSQQEQSHIEFISSYGWVVEPSPTNINDIIIPLEWGEVYTRYNQLQLAHGYDLSEYKGVLVKKHTYKLLNYPSSSDVFINILVYNNDIIGGDIMSIASDGFMASFDNNYGY